MGDKRGATPVECAQCAAPVERAQSVSSCGRFSIYVLKHIVFAAKLVDYSLRINKSNINQYLYMAILCRAGTRKLTMGRGERLATLIYHCKTFFLFLD